MNHSKRLNRQKKEMKDVEMKTGKFYVQTDLLNLDDQLVNTEIKEFASAAKQATSNNNPTIAARTNVKPTASQEARQAVNNVVNGVDERREE